MRREERKRGVDCRVGVKKERRGERRSRRGMKDLKRSGEVHQHESVQKKRML
jgi:hypothetical protein